LRIFRNLMKQAILSSDAFKSPCPPEQRQMTGDSGREVKEPGLEIVDGYLAAILPSYSHNEASETKLHREIKRSPPQKCHVYEIPACAHR
jgi:hypothetical protein